MMLRFQLQQGSSTTKQAVVWTSSAQGLTSQMMRSQFFKLCFKTMLTSTAPGPSIPVFHAIPLGSSAGRRAADLLIPPIPSWLELLLLPPLRLLLLLPLLLLPPRPPPWSVALVVAPAWRLAFGTWILLADFRQPLILAGVAHAAISIEHRELVEVLPNCRSIRACLGQPRHAHARGNGTPVIHQAYLERHQRHLCIILLKMFHQCRCLIMPFKMLHRCHHHIMPLKIFALRFVTVSSRFHRWSNPCPSA